MENTEVTKIPFGTTRVPDNTKPVGEELVVQDGVDGTRTIVSIDGHVTSDRTIAPKNQVVYYGTLEKDEEPDILPPRGEDTGEPTASNVPLPEKETPENVEVDTNPSQTVETPVSNQSQGRFSENKEISNVNTSVLKKAALEAARLIVFAIPGILITVLTDNPSLGGSLGGTILLVLKSIDRSIHENPATPVKGLLPF